MDWLQDSWSVEQWLQSAGMDQYTGAFLDNGYDTRDLCSKLGAEDLDAIGVEAKHRSQFYQAARSLREGLPAKVLEVLATKTQQPYKLSPSSDAAQGGYTDVWQPHVHKKKAKDKSKGGGKSPHVKKGSKANGAVQNGGEQETVDGEKRLAVKLPKPRADTSSQVLSPTHPPAAASLSPTASVPPKPLKPVTTSLSPQSPSLPPYPREDGSAPIGLTKLQLKLKIRDELQISRVILTEQPYTEEGQMVSEKFEELAELYGERFKVEPLEVYDALQKMWRVETSQFATPIGSEEGDSASMTSAASSRPTSTTYDEPFDSPRGPGPKLSRESQRSLTLPVNAVSLPDYDEPFDSVVIPSVTLATPTAEQDSPPTLPPRNKLQSATMPPSPDTRRVSHEESSIKQKKGFKKFWKSKSKDEVGGKGRHSSTLSEDKGRRKLHGSAEYLSGARGSTGDTPSTSGSECSPHPSKKHSQFSSRAVSQDRAVEDGDAASFPDETIKALEGNEARQSTLWASQSTDDLHDVGRHYGSGDLGPAKEGRKKGGIMSRLFRRTIKASEAKKSMKSSTSPVNRLKESHGLTASVSMPDIALISTAANRASQSFLKPPKPPRYSKKTPPASPDSSPLLKRKVLIASSTESSGTDNTIPIHSGSAPGFSILSDFEDHQKKSTPSLNLNPPRQYGNLPPKPSSVSSEECGSQLSGLDCDPQSPVSIPSSLSSRDSRLTQEDESLIHETPPPGSKSPSIGSVTSLERVALPLAPSSLKRPLPPPKPRKNKNIRKSSPVLSGNIRDSGLLVESPVGSLKSEETRTQPQAVTNPPPKPARRKGKSGKLEGSSLKSDSEAPPSPAVSSEGTTSPSRLKEEVPSGVKGPSSIASRIEKFGSEENLIGHSRENGVRKKDAKATKSLPTTPSDSKRPRPPKPTPTPKPRLVAKPTPMAKPVRAATLSSATPSSATPSSIEDPLHSKLAEEKIDLTMEPYSSKSGKGGVPRPLISRYAKELQADEETVAMAMEELRHQELKKKSRVYFPTDKADLLKPTPPPAKGNLSSFLVAIGLPMYIDGFKERGFTMASDLLAMKDFDLQAVKLKPSHRTIFIANVRSLRSRKV